MDNFSIQSESNNHNSLSEPLQGRSVVPEPVQVQSSVSGPESQEIGLPVAPGSSAVVTVGREGSGDVGASDRNDRSERRPNLGPVALDNTVRDLRPVQSVTSVIAAASEAAVKGIVRRVNRYVLRGKWGKYSKLKGLRACGHAMAASGVRLVSKDGKVAHYRGVLRCASAWSCPVCSATIRAYRAQEIKQGILYALNDLGYSVYMVTRTQQHTLKNPLKQMMQSMSIAKRRADQSGNVKALYDSLDRVGSIMAKEVTRSYQNGWHVHTHELMIFKQELTDGQFIRLNKVLFNAMNKQFIRLGLNPIKAKYLHVQRVTKGAKEVGEYLSKLDGGFNADMEMTRSDLKKGRNGSRTPMQILEDFCAYGDVEDSELYQEYELATKGHHVLHWTPDLKEILQVKEPELTDDQLMEKIVGGKEYLEFDNWYFKIIKAYNIDGQILAAFYLGGVDGVLSYLTDLGIYDEDGVKVLDLDSQEVKTAFDVKLDNIIKQYVNSCKEEKAREEFKNAIGEKYLVRHGWRELYEKAIEDDRVDKDVKPDIVTHSAEPVERTSYTQGELDL